MQVTCRNCGSLLEKSESAVKQAVAKGRPFDICRSCATTEGLLKRGGVSRLVLCPTCGRRRQRPREEIESVCQYCKCGLSPSLLSSGENLSYFLGFLITDGFVSKTKKEWFVSSTDLDIIEKLRDVALPGKQIRTSQGKQLMKQGNLPKPCYELRGYSKSYDQILQLLSANDKEEFGIPSCVKGNERHFLRAHLEGDGTLRIGDCPSLVFLGRGKIITEIRDFIEGIGLKGTLSQVKLQENCTKQLYRLQFGKTSGILYLLHYLYDGATLYMKRKHDTAHEIMGMLST